MAGPGEQVPILQSAERCDVTVRLPAGVDLETDLGGLDSRRHLVYESAKVNVGRRLHNSNKDGTAGTDTQTLP